MRLAPFTQSAIQRAYPSAFEPWPTQKESSRPGKEKARLIGLFERPVGSY
jgi:hypothetical protein